jgi:hypothetical protein
MSKWMTVLGGGSLVAVFSAIALFTTGCEEASGLGGLTIKAATTTLTAETRTLDVSAEGVDQTNSLALPLVWSVSNPELGTLSGATGVTAIYTRTQQNGINTLSVMDQYENEGYLAIRQETSLYSLLLTVMVDGVETTLIPVGSDSATILAKSSDEESVSIAPYTWSVTSGSGSIVGGQGSSTAVFRSNGEGSSAIEVVDGNGVVGAISITQAVGDGEGPGGPGGPGTP